MDYKGLNNVTINIKFLIPVTEEEIMDELFGNIIFSNLDLSSGYYQIQAKLKDLQKIVLRIHEVYYEFLTMPFKLTYAPSTFHSIMNEVFKPYHKNLFMKFL